MATATITDNLHLNIEVTGETPLAVSRTILFLGDPKSLLGHLPLYAEAYRVPLTLIEEQLLEEGSLKETPPWFHATVDGPFTIKPVFESDEGHRISGEAHVMTTLDLGGLLGAMSRLCTAEVAEEVRARLEATNA